MLSCPRCGYDLRGVVHTWTECCPLRGRCSECALDFEWWQIFSTPLAGKLFEHRWHREPVRSALWTVAHAARPWSFWRTATLFDFIRLWPIVLLAVGLSVAALLALQMQMVLFVCEAGFRVTGSFSLFKAWSSLAGSLASIVNTNYSTVFRIGALLVWPVGFPLLFVLVPVTLSRVQVQARHIVRIAAYSWLPLLAALLLWQGGLLVYDLISIDRAIGRWSGSERVFWPSRWRMWVRWDTLPFDPPQVVIFVLTAIWTVMWWKIACGQYLRLKSSGRIVLAFSVIMGLVTAIILTFEYLGKVT